MQNSLSEDRCGQVLYSLFYESRIRMYRMEAGVDLAGGFFLKRVWRGRNSRRGGGKLQHFFSRDALLQEVARVHRVRLRHGYDLLTAQPDWFFSQESVRQDGILASTSRTQGGRPSSSPSQTYVSQMRSSQRMLKKAASQLQASHEAAAQQMSLPW